MSSSKCTKTLNFTFMQLDRRDESLHPTFFLNIVYLRLNGNILQYKSVLQLNRGTRIWDILQTN